MKLTQPIVDTTVEDDFTLGKTLAGSGRVWQFQCGATAPFPDLQDADFSIVRNLRRLWNSPTGSPQHT